MSAAEGLFGAGRFCKRKDARSRLVVLVPSDTLSFLYAGAFVGETAIEGKRGKFFTFEILRCDWASYGRFS